MLLECLWNHILYCMLAQDPTDILMIINIILSPRTKHLQFTPPNYFISPLLPNYLIGWNNE